MKDYIRNDFKLSFIKDFTEFFVNEKKGTVTCVVTAQFLVPYYSFEVPTFVNTTMVKGIGTAKCSGNDTFDVDRGKRIALAKAENNCYKKATSYLADCKPHFEIMLNLINNFNKKAVAQCEHNKEYINRISDIDNPEYKKVISKINHGTTHYTK